MKWLQGIFISFILLFTCSAFGQDNVVIEVEIKGLLTSSEDLIKSKLEIQERKIFSPDALKKDIQRLHQMGLFSNIEVQVNETLSGVKVIFVVVENQLLGEVKIFGNNHIPTEEIIKELRIAKEKYLVPYALSLDEITIKEMYQKEGFLFAGLKIKKVPTSGWIDVYFEIDEGPRVYIREIRLFGNKSYPKDTLLQLIETKESGIFSNSHYDEEAFLEDLILMRNFYRSEGFLDARLELRDVFFSTDREQLVINVKVVEGPRYYIKKISFKGNVLFSVDELRNRMGLKEASPFKQNDMLIDKSRIERLYGENGYLNIKTRPRVTLPDLKSRTVEIEYVIEEGRKTYLRRVDIKGNDLTRDYVIRRELEMIPGEQFNFGKIEKSQNRLQRLGFFETIKMDLDETDHESWKDLVVKVEEGRTGNLRFAAGITSDLGAVGEITVSKRNFDISRPPTSFADFFSGESFTGAGQDLDIQFQGGQDILRFRISFTEPQLFGYNLIFGMSLFKQERIRESFDEDRTGGKLTFGRKLSLDSRLNFSYRLENVEIEDLDNDAPQDVVDVEGGNIISSVTLDYTYDTRDSFILATRGFSFGISYELAGLAFGGDHDFSLINLRFAYFQTIYTNEDNFKHILSFGTRVGLGFGHADTDEVPIFERFFAGGSNSIRGFEFRTVGPRANDDPAELTDDPIGGEFLLTSTIEYSIPLYQDTLRMVLFTDMGNVAPEVGDNIFDEFRAAAGFGFRIKIPVLGPRPFAFDFAIPILEEDDDDTQVFSFSFGKPF